MKTAIIVGSHRANSQSTKVGKFIQDDLHGKGHDSFLYDLRTNPLPLWDESIWEGAEKWKEIWGPIAKELETCDSAVVIAPEWGGMVPAGLKNFFLLLGKELAHKPAVIVGVSGSRGGAYPVAELRQSSYKNSFVCYIPDHIIVRDVESVLNDGAAASDDDKFIRGKIDYSLQMLELYSKGLAVVRESGKVDFKTYPFGM
jgi:NAD(P)H-dependent FMN reductase